MGTAMLIGIALAGLFVGANIGANDSANCIGPSVGAGIVRYRLGITMVAICVAAGGILQSGDVISTVGKGIVTDPLEPRAVLAALLCGGFFVAVATFFKLPVSASQSVVGAVAGVGMAGNLTVDWSKTGTIVQSWILCPILSMAMTWAIYRLLLAALQHIQTKRSAVNRGLQWMVVLSAGYSAYSLGANNLGLAIGPIAALDTGTLSVRWLTVAGALSVAAGALLFGRGVTETVGRSIIPLDTPGAFAVQVSSGFGLHLFSMLGVPVSSSQAVVGALAGIGLYRGIKTLSRRKMAEIGLGWVLTPTMAGLVAFGLYTAMRQF